LHTGTFVPAGQSERLSRMSSQTQHQPGAHPPSLPAASAPSAPGSGTRTSRRGRNHRRRLTVVLAVALVLAVGGLVYVGLLARAWADHADSLDATARELGTELAETRGELEESQGTLALVESQLDGAQDQIHELANTVAQTGDDREVQRQMTEYQAELFTAASGVTGTMASCITDQQDYVLALEEELVRERSTPPPSDDEDATEEPSAAAEEDERPDLPALREALVESCEAAAEAQEDLQRRLGDS